ncbi:GntR family transcriptional regulator [Streptomyces dengpaensis]|uniref:GntR family transcriptional regulator n=1 Tax=Streptomyces dengpaensis TaxID=2049881 RepID=A0ABN5IEE5_9ACTN|nr:GntR family transcriptional regulator [Streptomyces dengpaensis]
MQTEAPKHNVAGVPSPLALTAGALQKVDKRDRTARYAQVADELRGAIERSELTAGDRLPSFAELHQFFGVTVTTAQRALRILKDEGLIEGRKGEGVFVRAAGDRTVRVPVGQPGEAARLLRESMSEEDLATLAKLLATP